jgi:hypothetical protein
MSEKTTCPNCGAPANVDLATMQREILRCDVCDARLVYGTPALRVVQEPSTFDTPDGPKPAFLLRFQDPKTKADLFSLKLDPYQAFLHAQGIIATVRP